MAHCSGIRPKVHKSLYCPRVFPETTLVESNLFQNHKVILQVVSLVDLILVPESKPTEMEGITVDTELVFKKQKHLFAFCKES